MKNKLIFRILGALASALIIVSVFVPFVSVTGYNTNLWQTYESTNSLYLPIMIIVFGVIGVIFFSLNIKTELAYMSSGATVFFIVIETISIIEQDAFGSLGIGYYLLAVGSVLTGIMAFITNLRQKKKEQVVVENKTEEETSMIAQIDKLYDEQNTTQNEILPIQQVDNIVQPLPVQPLETVSPIQPVESIIEEKEAEDIPIDSINEEVKSENVEVIQQPVIEQTQAQNDQLPVNPVLQEFNVPSVQEIPVAETVVVQEQPVLENQVSQPVNPTLQEFSQLINPVVQEFEVPSASTVEQIPVVPNPVLQEFSQSINPVVQEFGISNSVPVVEQNPVVQEQPAVTEEVSTVPLVNISEPVNPTVQEFNNDKPGFTINPQQPSGELDIFGQPINK